MTQPVQEPTQGRIDQGQEFRSRQLFRRPSSSPPGTGSRFTYILFGGDEPVVADASTGDSVGFFSIPRDLDGAHLTDAEVFVKSPSSSGDVQVRLWRFYPDPNGSSVNLLNGGGVVDSGDFTSNTSSDPLDIKWTLATYFDAFDYFFLEVKLDGTDTLGLGVHLTLTLNAVAPP